MEYTYKLKTDTISDDEGNSVEVYGIVCSDSSSNLIKAVSNVFTNKEEAEQFISLCNKLELSPVHLQDVIDEAVS